MVKKRNSRKDRNKPTQNDSPIAGQVQGQTSLAQLAKSSDDKKPFRVGSQLRNSFLTGLIIVGPIGITAFAVYTFVNWVDSWVKPTLLKFFPKIAFLVDLIPGLGLIFAVFGIMVVGALTANLLGRSLLNLGEGLLDTMPVVRNLYRAIKQIFETVLSQSGNSFQKVGLIEYPREGLYAIVFVSTEAKGEISDICSDGGTVLSVFLPTTPNPTSGYLLFLPKEDVIILDMTVEEGAKLVISAGLVVPEGRAKEIIAEKGELNEPDAVGVTDGEVVPEAVGPDVVVNGTSVDSDADSSKPS